MQAQDQNLDFLINKIREIKVAVFKADMNALIQLPNNIITTFKTDNDGNIFFFTSCNSSCATNTDKHFYAYLEYFQKGSECRLQVSGKASIVEDDVELDRAPVVNIRGKVLAEYVLVKMKIYHAKYFENKHSTARSLTSRIKNLLGELFDREDHRMFDFS